VALAGRLRTVRKHVAQVAVTPPVTELPTA